MLIRSPEVATCLAEYHAARLLSDYGPPPLSRQVVLTLCARRGVEPLKDARITEPAVYLGPPHRLIVHRPAAPAWVLARELFHDLIATANPDDLAAFPQEDEEQLCNRFATLLCGPSPILAPRAPTVITKAPAQRQDYSEHIRAILETWATEARYSRR